VARCGRPLLAASERRCWAPRHESRISAPSPVSAAADLPWVADRARLIGEQRGRRCALTQGHRTDLLVLAHGEAEEKLVAAFPAPLPLADQNLCDRHCVELPSVTEDYLSSGQLATRNSALDRGASASHVIGPLKCPNVLRAIACRKIHEVSTTPPVGSAALMLLFARTGPLTRG
jgi:hypothetical protein